MHDERRLGEQLRKRHHLILVGFLEEFKLHNIDHVCFALLPLLVPTVSFLKDVLFQPFAGGSVKLLLKGRRKKKKKKKKNKNKKKKEKTKKRIRIYESLTWLARNNR